MGGAKEEQLYALAFLFQVLAVASLAKSSENSTNFSFLSFGDNNKKQLKYLGNASYSSSGGYIDLTPSPNIPLQNSTAAVTGKHYSKMYNSIGRVIYHEPITVWPATFTTTFTIFVENITIPVGVKNFNADGLAFIIVPNDKPSSPESYGSYLGIFDPLTDGSATNQLAIEFDTFWNEWDPNSNHVGIDINSIQSNVTANLGPKGIQIKSGRPIKFRVHYDGWNKILQIFAAYADQPIHYKVVLIQKIVLSRIVPRSAYLGFSASTGNSFEIQRILDWNFSSEILPKSSLSVGMASGAGSISKGLKIGLIVGSIIVWVVVSGLLAWFVARNRKRRRDAVGMSGGRFSVELALMDGRSAASSYAPCRFCYKRLSTATKNFSETEFLGSGGFGSVYRGTLEGHNGAIVHVAVKRISAGSRQGEREFISEISTIGRLRHRNLVQFHGWCHERDELLLVYEYMPNGSLENLLFRQQGDQNQNQNQALLNWPRRHKIICGLASALLYLHEEWEQKVVHRDIKPSNIMLDGDFNTRLGDFGLARLIEHDETNPAVTTMVAGTLGYVAPECGYTGKATAESDVFSFGIVVLEVASGRRVVEGGPSLSDGNLVDWIWSLYGQGKIMEAADPRLDGDFDEEQMERVLILGLACSHPDPQLRPPIRQALQVLINPNEQMMSLPSTRPIAIYVVLPSETELDSRSTSQSNVVPAGSASTSSAFSGGVSITAPTIHDGR